MNKSDEEFYKELLNDFKEEGAEHLQTIVNGLLDVEKEGSTDDQELLETIFRETHSLKGSARAVDLKTIENLCMAMESVMHKVKNKKLDFSPAFFDVFFEATDILEVLISEISGSKQSITENRISKVVNSLKMLEKGKYPSVGSDKKEASSAVQSSQTHPAKEQKTNQDQEFNKQQEQTEEPASVEKTPEEPEAKESADTANVSQNESIRVSIQKLNDILYSAEEMITSKAVLKHEVKQVESIFMEFSKLKREISEAFLNISAEDKTRESFNKIESDLSQTTRQLEGLLRNYSRGVDDLNFKVKKAMMQPFSVMLSVIPRIVRDFAKEHEKKIDLSIEGEHIEIDRRILEQMKDPLIHLIRNSIDHGIEKTSERLKNKKKEQGKLSIKVFHEAGQKICITLEDDGKGLDYQKILESAIKNKAIKPGEEKSMTKEQINQLIFSSGVSASPIITDVSGRGLGMAIVAEKIGRLGGDISLETKPQCGTTFRIELPQTLSTFKGILVEVSGQKFLFPTTAVSKALKVKKTDIKPVGSRSTIRLKNESVSLVPLSGVLGLNRKGKSPNENLLQVLIIQNKGKMAFSIDHVLGEHEGMVKPLGKQLKHVNNIEGACFMGDGSVVPVLQVDELMQAAKYASGQERFSKAATPALKEEGETKNVLVAEDSITVRNMVRSHIEAAGYKVTTAVDGQAAFEQLQKGGYDILVSDIEMPRMNGFELTSKIRNSKELESLPVILVTSLETKEDRDRGLESGANAYIVKSSFEKSNLIDTINRLI
ncbi:MAG: hybrid sensor histidine kinase/response regulator [Bacteroidota bacterium]